MDFFDGLSRFIPERCKPKSDPLGSPYSEDGRAGMELMLRKINRMKEKMKDATRFYTFDLFEEYLFALMIETYQILDELDPVEEPTAAIQKTAEELRRLDVEEDIIDALSSSVWQVTKMGIDDSALFFWDDDYAVVFGDGFISGIRSLVGGSAAIMGYGYEDVCNIFTDAGIKVPLLLVGSETAFDTVGEVTQERMSKIPNPFDDMEFGDEEVPEDIDDLPFS